MNFARGGGGGGGGGEAQVNLVLRDLGDNTLNCTLWEAYVMEFLEYQQKQVDTTKPTVMILRYAKVKEQGKFPIAVTNTYNVTKLQINKDIININDFVKWLPKVSSTRKSLTTTSTNIRGWSQQSSSSHMSITEKFLDKSIQIKLNQIIQLVEARITDPLEFPLALDAMLGKKFAFKEGEITSPHNPDPATPKVNVKKMSPDHPIDYSVNHIIEGDLSSTKVKKVTKREKKSTI
ncbi:unnamed protein product [Vicia faba]|uniref:Uncharacterized protein n=1 Tax=Vicia faba TaxID=3906 RepID=A0AAV0Z4E3_VICFA|nr:unnamed protein product [Vicia faba]